MATPADVRPPARDLLIRPGTTVTVLIEWSPSGALDGRTFASTVDGEDLDVTVDGDTLTVVADDTITGALDVDVPVAWELTEDIDGTAEPIVIGTWIPSDAPRAVDSDTFQVTEGAATFTVEALTTVPVTSVNDQRGSVSLDADDVGADPAGTGPGQELAEAEHDALFSTDVEFAAGGEAVPGLEITFTMPPIGRPVIVEALASLNSEEEAEGAALGLFRGPSDDAGPELVHAAMGGLQIPIITFVQPRIRVPNQHWSPAPGSEVTVHARLGTTADATGDALLIAGTFFGSDYVAQLRAQIS